MLAHVAVVTALVFLAGCGPRIAWRLDGFERVHSEAAGEGRLTLVYFRDWAAVECTQFEEKVLKDPGVVHATGDLHCVPLSYHWDKPLAEKWGVQRIPAVVIVHPNGQVLARLAGSISREVLLEAIDRSHQSLASATRPAAAP